MSKFQSEIISLVRKLLTAKRDTNALLKNQSPFCCWTQEFSLNAHDTAAEKADEPRINRSKLITKLLKTILNRFHEDSTKDKSEDSDDEHVFDDEYITHTERQRGISFFRKRKRPQHKVKMVIEPSDP